MSTMVQAMWALQEEITSILESWRAETKAQGTKIPIAVYAGYPPIRESRAEHPSYIYALVTDSEDTENDGATVTVEIGANIYDDDKQEGCFALYNVLEAIRIGLLKKRTVGKKHRLILPMTFAVAEEQSFPNWQGKLTVTYTIGQPREELNFNG